MKKFLKMLLCVFIVSCLMCSSAYASSVEPEEGAGAGITPDSILYVFDQPLEYLQLAFSTTPEGDADLHLQFANERLAEANAMDEEEKDALAEQAMEDYYEEFGEAQESVAQAILGETEGEPEEGSEGEEPTVETADQEADMEEELEEHIDNGYLVSNVVQGLDIDQVLLLRQMGLGYGRIAQAFTLADNSEDYTVEEIAALFVEEGMGFGDVAEMLGLSPSDLNKNGNVADVEEPEILEEAALLEVEGEEEPEDESDEDIGNGYMNSNALEGLDPDIVLLLKEMGLGNGEIAQAFTLAEYSEYSVVEIGEFLVGEDVGYGDVCEMIEKSPSEINKDTKSNGNAADKVKAKIEKEDDDDDEDDEDNEHDEEPDEDADFD